MQKQSIEELKKATRRIKNLDDEGVIRLVECIIESLLNKVDEALFIAEINGCWSEEFDSAHRELADSFEDPILLGIFGPSMEDLKKLYMSKLSRIKEKQKKRKWRAS